MWLIGDPGLPVEQVTSSGLLENFFWTENGWGCLEKFFNFFYFGQHFLLHSLFAANGNAVNV